MFILNAIVCCLLLVRTLLTPTPQTKPNKTMPFPVKGIATQGATEKLGAFEFERRDPNEDDVHIEITYAGI